MNSSRPSRPDHPAVLHVRPVVAGGTTWEICPDDAPKALSRHATQFDAIALALMLSRKSGAAVHVYDPTGRVRVLPSPNASSRPPERLTGT